MAAMTVGADGVAPWWAGRQRILNSRAVPGRFTAAAPPVPVVARLVWADDGEELVETVATAWTSPLVLVAVGDPRSAYRGVWVPARDVTRR